MILYLILTLIIGVVGIVLNVFPTVTELPFGVDSVMVTFVGTIKALLLIFPPLQAPWNVIITGLTIEFLLFSWTWIRWILERIR